MELTSPAFSNGSPIPTAYTAKGHGISPPLYISNVPPGARSLALIVYDPDAPKGNFTHWILWNISATTTVIKEGTVPTAAAQGINDAGTIGYTPPSPPSGTHRYFFTLYALNRELALAPGAHLYAVTANLEGHILATAELVGTASA